MAEDIDNQTRHVRRKIICRWIPAFIWMAVIFAFSSQANSNETTQHLFGPDLNYGVRKGAHMTEFAVLFLLLKYAIAGKMLGTKAALLSRRSILAMDKHEAIAFALAVLYACTDEWHQGFVPGRSALVSDVFIDASGCLVIWIVLTVIRRLGPKQNVTQ